MGADIFDAFRRAYESSIALLTFSSARTDVKYSAVDQIAFRAVEKPDTIKTEIMPYGVRYFFSMSEGKENYKLSIECHRNLDSKSFKWRERVLLVDGGEQELRLSQAGMHQVIQFAVDSGKIQKPDMVLRDNMALVA
jgi:hypothetical protein